MSEEIPTAEGLSIEQRQFALIVTLDRPQARNALTAAMVDGLMAVCAWAKGRRSVRALVLRGADGSFCAGGDIKDFAAQLSAPEPEEGEPDPVARGNRRFGDLMQALDGLDQPLICAVEGAAFGGAMGFLAVADMVIAQADAKFALSETSLGIPPAQIGPFLVRKLGLYPTRRLALTGARFGSEEALALGLVNQVVGDAQALSAALTDTVSAIGRCEPEANAVTKALLNASALPVTKETLDKASDGFAACLRGAGRTGAAAFAAKTPPPWRQAFDGGEE